MRRLMVLMLMATAVGCAHGVKRTVIDFDPETITADAMAAELSGLNDTELFALGKASFAAEDFRKAALCFLRLGEAFPQSKHVREARQQAGLSLMRLGRYSEAAEQLRGVADPLGNHDALEAAFRRAECLYQIQDFVGAIAILHTVAQRTDLGSALRLQAMVQEGVSIIESGALEAGERKVREALAFWEAHKEEDQLDDYFPAQAQFFIGEIYRLRFEEVPLAPELGQEKLMQNLEYKCELLLTAQNAFLRAIRIGEPRWGTAGGFRIGALYESLFDAMVFSKTPIGLDSDQEALYREELKKRVKILVTKAMTIYERTLAAAERTGVESPFVARTRESLERMKALLLEAPTSQR